MKPVGKCVYVLSCPGSAGVSHQKGRIIRCADLCYFSFKTCIRILKIDRSLMRPASQEVECQRLLLIEVYIGQHRLCPPSSSTVVTQTPRTRILSWKDRVLGCADLRCSWMNIRLWVRRIQIWSYQPKAIAPVRLNSGDTIFVSISFMVKKEEDSNTVSVNASVLELL